MENRIIPQIIKQVIAEKDRVYIPGFGTLLRTYIPARLDESSHQFFPPRYQFELDRSSQYDDPFLVQTLCTQLNLDRLSATHVVNEYGGYLRKQMDANGTVDIPDVLSVDTEDGGMVVVPSEAINFGDYPTVELDDLWESNASNKGVWWELSVFVSFMLLILAGVYFMVNASKVPNNYPYSSSQYPPLIGLDDTSKTDQNSSLADIDMMESQPMDTVPEVQNDQEISDELIIVGSFSRKENQDAMKLRLQELGWTVFEEPVNKMVRIGIVPEEHERIDEVLGIVRKEVEQGAWILKKQ